MTSFPVSAVTSRWVHRVGPWLLPPRARIDRKVGKTPAACARRSPVRSNWFHSPVPPLARASAPGQLATGSQGPRPSSSRCHHGHNSHRRIVRFDRRNQLLNRSASVVRDYMNPSTSPRAESKTLGAIEKQPPFPR
jgi:hypothetical protein